MHNRPISILRKNKKLIHCITNPISINQCANAILAVGARPIMAEHPLEVKEITATASALMLNTGNITDIRMKSMSISAEEARRLKIPFIIDAVGTACSELRRTFVINIINTYSPNIIKGNYSEIYALYNEAYHSSGIDSDKNLDISQMKDIMPLLAKKYKAVILASGAVDLITDGNKFIHIKNGTSMLSGVTGTGCMLGAICASCLSSLPALDAACTASVLLGIAGEIAEKNSKGSGSFSYELMDALYNISDQDIEEKISMEEFNVEKV